MFSCEFWEISKNTFFTEHLWTTASVSETHFYTEIVVTLIPIDLGTNWFLSLFYSFVRSKNENQFFKEVCSMVTKNICVFCL